MSLRPVASPTSRLLIEYVLVGTRSPTILDSHCPAARAGSRRLGLLSAMRAPYKSPVQKRLTVRNANRPRAAWTVRFFLLKVASQYPLPICSWS